jgi:hypothetical protein
MIRQSKEFTQDGKAACNPIGRHLSAPKVMLSRLVYELHDVLLSVIIQAAELDAATGLLEKLGVVQ